MIQPQAITLAAVFPSVVIFWPWAHSMPMVKCSQIVVQSTYQNMKEHSKLVASDEEAGDGFGYSVDIYGGNLIVGNPGDGSVYIFEYCEDTDEWLQIEKLTVEIVNPLFESEIVAFPVGISGDTAVVGVSTDGVVYVFKKESDKWIEMGSLSIENLSNEAFFGMMVSISENHIIVGAPGDENDQGISSGAVYVFEKDASDKWREKWIKLTPENGSTNDAFGNSVSIAGDVIVVGAFGQNELTGAAYVYELNESGDWIEMSQLVADNEEPEDMFGYSVNISGRGNKIIVGAYGDRDNGSYSGSAYTFEKDTGGAWVRRSKLIGYANAKDDMLGYSVAISQNTAVVGSIKADNNAGAVFFAESSYKYH